MSLKSMTNSELHQSFERVAHTERKIMGLVFEHINEVDLRRLYLDYGYASLYAYLVGAMKYSESCAYRRIASARLVKNHSEIAEKVQAGTINLSQLTELNKGLKKAGKQLDDIKTQDIVNHLENKTIYASQQMIAKALDLPIEQVTKVKPQQDESVRLEVTLSKKQFEELKKAQDLLSHIVIDGNWAEVIATLASKFNQVKLGKENANKSTSEIQNKSRTQNVPQSLSNQPNSRKLPRKYLSIKIKRELLQTANYQCQFHMPNGERCACTYQLQIDHMIPLAKGGSDHPSNMRILCAAHNRSEACRCGLAKMTFRERVKSQASDVGTNWS